jgi:signal transduction histidine kinase
MCKKIVEHHGGKIWVDKPVEGAETTGTTVRFTLPVVRTSASSASPSATEAELSDVTL